MGALTKIKEALFGPPVWQMDKDYVVEWQTQYKNKDTNNLETDLIRLSRKLDILALFIKGSKLISSTKLQKLINNEIENILLGLPRETELVELLKLSDNIEILGHYYDPKYDHEQYKALSKQRQGTDGFKSKTARIWFMSISY